MKNELNLEGTLGLVTGLPLDDFDGAPLELSITFFAAFDPKAADRINSIRDDRLRTKKMNDFIQDAAKNSDPILEAFAYGDRLKGTGVRFFFGDENENIEEFIDENKAAVDRYLEEINRHAIGGFTFSSYDEGVDASSTVRELLQHLEENYFNVDET
ncbi:MAG: hypothetical protein J0L82_04370 [Deltaproteobacteria bacterium]|nr:hypothetical protein [Deltaproteobacteria bacterium]